MLVCAGTHVIWQTPGGLGLELWQMYPARTILRQQEERTAWLEAQGCVLSLPASPCPPGGQGPLPAPAPSLPMGLAPLPSQPSSLRPGAPPSWFYTTLTPHTTNLPGKRPLGGTLHIPRSWCSTNGQDGQGWKTLTKHLVPLYRQGN